MNFDKDTIKFEDSNNIFKADSRIKEVSNSYITKENFIEMINTLNFKFIESARLHFITGFRYNEEKDEVKSIGFDIEID